MIIDHNVTTGVTITREYTAEELAEITASAAAHAEYNTLDNCAARAIDGIDRLQFEHLFDLENRMRAQEGLAAITKAQYRTALINKWKALNG